MKNTLKTYTMHGDMTRTPSGLFEVYTTATFEFNDLIVPGSRTIETNTIVEVFTGEYEFNSPDDAADLLDDFLSQNSALEISYDPTPDEDAPALIIQEIGTPRKIIFY